ncbi:hypothetical protein AKO1_007755 [Acrasis kona]|uniref:Uncharacterized protein n=1 Tax=Acrasis kona TaxID=1008807 RepID=A0AAW2YR57_9EUKA
MEGWLYEFDKALGKESIYQPKQQVEAKSTTTKTPEGTKPTEGKVQKEKIDLDAIEEQVESVYVPPPVQVDQEHTIAPSVDAPEPQQAVEEHDGHSDELIQNDDDNDTDTDSPRNIRKDDDDDVVVQKRKADTGVEITDIPQALELLDEFSDNLDMIKVVIAYLEEQRVSYSQKIDEYIGSILNSDGLQPLMIVAEKYHTTPEVASYVIFAIEKILSKETETYRTMVRLFNGFHTFTQLLTETQLNDHLRSRSILQILAILCSRKTEFSDEFMKADFMLVSSHLNAILDDCASKKSIKTDLSTEESKQVYALCLTILNFTLNLCTHNKNASNVAKSDLFRCIARISKWFGPGKIDDILIPVYKIANLCTEEDVIESMANQFINENTVSVIVIDIMGKHLRDPKITQITVRIMSKLARSESTIRWLKSALQQNIKKYEVTLNVMTVLSHAVDSSNVQHLVKLEIPLIMLQILQEYLTQGWVVKYCVQVLLQCFKIDPVAHRIMSTRQQDQYGVERYDHILPVVDCLMCFASNSELSQLIVKLIFELIVKDKTHAQEFAKTGGCLVGLTNAMNANNTEADVIEMCVACTDAITAQANFQDLKGSEGYIVADNEREELVRACMNVCKKHPAEKIICVNAIKTLTNVLVKSKEVFLINPVESQMLCHVAQVHGDLQKKRNVDFVQAFVEFMKHTGDVNKENMNKYGVEAQSNDIKSAYENLE